MYSEVIDAWRAQAHEEGQTPVEYFTRLACKILQDAGREDMEENFTYVPDCYMGEKKIPVNGYSYDSENRDVTLFHTIFDIPEEQQISPRLLSKAKTESSFKEMRNFCKEIFSGHFDDLVPGTGLFELVDLILHGDGSPGGKRPTIRLYLVANSHINKVYVPQNLSFERNGDAICCEALDYEAAQSFSAVPPSLNFSDCEGGGIPFLKVVTNKHVDFFKAYLLVIPGVALAKAYASFKDGLLEKNVRGYLHKTKTNKRIGDTIKDEPDLCFLYNNGLTLTATELVEKDGLITELKGVQVVNGGQTTATIHKEWLKSHQSVERVFVQAKLTVVPESYAEGLVRKIAIYSNSQNAVKDVDLQRSENIQRSLEYYSRNTPTPHGKHWYYERVKKQYLTEKGLRKGPSLTSFIDKYHKKIDADKLASAVWAFEKNPVLVAQGLTKVVNAEDGFTKTMNKLLDENPSYKKKYNQLYKDCVAKYILYEVELSRKFKDFINDNYPGNSDQSRHTLAYTVHAFMICLAHKGKTINFNMIWENQNCSPQLRASIMSVGEVIAKLTQDKSRTWFRLKDSWKSIEPLFRHTPIWLSLDCNFPEAMDGIPQRYSDMLIKNDTSSDERIQRIRMVSALDYFRELKDCLGNSNPDVISNIRGSKKLIEDRLSSPDELKDAQCLKLYEIAQRIENSEYAHRIRLMDYLSFSIVREKDKRRYKDMQGDSVSMFTSAGRNAVYIAFLPCNGAESCQHFQRLCLSFPELLNTKTEVEPIAGTIQTSTLNDGRKVIRLYYAATAESMPYHQIFEVCFKALRNELPYRGEDDITPELFIECSDLRERWYSYLTKLPDALAQELDYVQAKWIYAGTEESSSRQD